GNADSTADLWPSTLSASRSTSSRRESLAGWARCRAVAGTVPAWQPRYGWPVRHNGGCARSVWATRAAGNGARILQRLPTSPLADAGPHNPSTLYSAILRELKTKKSEARFRKTERGKFELRAKA